MKRANMLAQNPFRHRSPPAWARPDGTGLTSLDAGWSAAAALTSLHEIVRADPPFAGAWRNRLALQAAGASARLAGYREDLAALRDAWFLRRSNNELGPAGSHLLAWRHLARDAADLSETSIRTAAVGFGAAPDFAAGPLLAAAQPAERTHSNPVRRAAAVASDICRLDPRQTFLAYWLADFSLARSLRWPIPLPLLVTEIAGNAARNASGVRTQKPVGEEWERLVAIAYARAASAALDLAGELSRRADFLIILAPKLRAKGAAKVVQSLLADDAIAPSARVDGMSDRGMRRLCDRLLEQGAVRELTGRTTFRLYGL